MFSSVINLRRTDLPAADLKFDFHGFVEFHAEGAATHLAFDPAGSGEAHGTGGGESLFNADERHATADGNQTQGLAAHLAHKFSTESWSLNKNKNARRD